MPPLRHRISQAGQLSAGQFLDDAVFGSEQILARVAFGWSSASQLL
jgi:hypothetical protein